jgi:hypothetical protein
MRSSAGRFVALVILPYTIHRSDASGVLVLLIPLTRRGISGGMLLTVTGCRVPMWAFGGEESTSVVRQGHSPARRITHADSLADAGLITRRRWLVDCAQVSKTMTVPDCAVSMLAPRP